MSESRFDSTPPGRRVPPLAWVMFGLVVVAGYFLLGGHRPHVVALLPYLFLLACPLMHIFHRHGGHRHHHPMQTQGPNDSDGQQPPVDQDRAGRGF